MKITLSKIIATIVVVVYSSSAFAARAYLVSETRTGMNKQCNYSYAGKEYTRTVKATDVCKSSIEV
jgi:hypothetical protein